MNKALKKGFALAVLLSLIGVSGAAADAALAELAGEWRGAWYLGMTSGVLTLRLSADANQPGTLQLTNYEKFGTEPTPLSEVKLQDNVLTFRALGGDGGALSARLTPSEDAAHMKGFAQHDGFNIRFEPSRVK